MLLTYFVIVALLLAINYGGAKNDNPLNEPEN